MSNALCIRGGGLATTGAGLVTIDVLLDGHSVRTRQGIVGFCTVLLVEGQQRTLFDVGHVGRRNVVLEALRQRGLTPDDIDNVVVSHAHWDHAQNLDVFANSKILIHPAERKYAQAPHPNDWATPAWSGSMLEHERERIVEIDEGFVIEPGVEVLHTPGHSVGSISLLAQTDAGACAISGDVLHYSLAAISQRNPVVFWDDAQATDSIKRIVEVADVIYPGHDRPFRVTPEQQIEYLRPLELTLFGVSGDDPGVVFEDAEQTYWVMPGVEEQPERLRSQPDVGAPTG